MRGENHPRDHPKMNTAQSTLDSYLSGSRPHKLEIGAGPNRKAGWLAADIAEHSSQTWAAFIKLDATQSFPIENNVFDLIYSEHMIEHIPFHDGQEWLE